MHLKRFRGNQLRVSLFLVVLSPGWAARSSWQTDVTLALLTVPEKNLPSGCQLTSNVPPAPPTVSPPTLRGGQTVITVNAGSSYHFSSNPWIRADRRLLRELRNRIDGVPRVPDAPPLSAREVAAWEQRWVADVVEGYRAAYRRRVFAEDAVVEPSAGVEVSAIRFSDATLATTTPAGIPRATRGVSDRLVKGAVVVRVEAGSKTDCFSAVAAYLRDVK